MVGLRARVEAAERAVIALGRLEFEWDEDAHPRGPDGKFGSGDGGEESPNRVQAFGADEAGRQAFAGMSNDMASLRPDEQAAIMEMATKLYGENPVATITANYLTLIKDSFNRTEVIDPHHLGTTGTVPDPDFVAKSLLWYDNVGGPMLDAIGRDSGLDRIAVAGIVAATSPNTPWSDRLEDKGSNGRIAQGLIRSYTTNEVVPDSKNIRAYLDGQKIDPSTVIGRGLADIAKEDPDTAARVYGALSRNDGRGAAGLFTNAADAFRILNGAKVDDVLRGVKTRSFYNNIENPAGQRDVTVDKEMVAAARIGGRTSRGESVAMSEPERTAAVSRPYITRPLPGREGEKPVISSKIPGRVNVAKEDLGVRPLLADVTRSLADHPEVRALMDNPKWPKDAAGNPIPPTGLRLQALVWCESRQQNTSLTNREASTKAGVTPSQRGALHSRSKQ